MDQGKDTRDGGDNKNASTRNERVQPNTPYGTKDNTTTTTTTKLSSQKAMTMKGKFFFSLCRLDRPCIIILIEDFDIGNDGNLTNKDQLDNQGKFYCHL